MNLERKLRENPTAKITLNETEYRELVEMLDATDQWIKADISNLKVEYIDALTPPDYSVKADGYQIDKTYSEGTYLLCTEDDKYLLSPSAFFTFFDRLKIKCKLLGELEKENDHHGIVTLMNAALSCLKGGNVTLLIRQNWIIAVHSAKYNSISQKAVFTAFDEAMQEKFDGDYEFVSATYSDLLTLAVFKLTDDEMIKSVYKDAWIDSGLHPDDLEASTPLISLIASDTARYSIQARPMFDVKFGTISTTIPLSEPSKSTHHNTTDYTSIKKSMDGIYAAVMDGAEFVDKLLKQRVDYPVQCFVHAVKESKLDRLTILPFIRLCEELEAEVSRTTKVSPLNPVPKKYTAFDVYLKICEVTKTPEYDAMLSSSKLALQEKMHQLKTNVNWRTIDKNDGATLKK